jgi:uncharacterized membrane protein YhaH (DUF805 family)
MLNNIYKLFFDRLYKFKGRSSRKEYIARLFLTTIIFLTWRYTVNIEHNNEFFAFVHIFSLFFFMVIMFFQYFPLTIRRLHDLNVSGRWLLVSLIIPCGQLMILWLMLAKGTSGVNKYGEEPMY